MEPLDGDFETKQARNAAKTNAMTMKSNIMKLIHKFRSEALQQKLYRELQRPQPNDITTFTTSFEDMKKLWKNRLCTSLEEHMRMQEQVETSGKRVKDLSKTLDDKKDQLEKFQKNAQEHKESRRQEIEQLKSAKGELRNEKLTMENQLTARGQGIKEASEKRHQETMHALQATIEQLTGDLKQVKDENLVAEKALLTAYDGADKQYTEALNSYDTEMSEKTKEKNEAEADCQDAEYQLSQIREQWSERIEERRKREALKAIMDKKEADQRKKQDTLNKAAQFLQAHYRGMLARREMERARKGKKGRKGRKKG